MAGSYECKRDGDLWIFLWHEQGIGIGIDHLSEEREGLHCEITVQSINAEGQMAGHIHWARLNLSATSTRGTLGRHLAERSPGPQWAAMLEIACTRAAREYREGLPVVDLDRVEIPEGTRYLIWPLCPLDETTILYGPAGTMKSTLALALGVSAATAAIIPGMDAPERTVSVLYLDWESHEIEHAERLLWLTRGFNLPAMPSIYYRQMHRGIADEAAQVKTIRARLNAEYVIYDSLGGACNGNLNDPDVAIRAMNAMRSIGGTRTAIAHMSGEGIKSDSSQSKPFGSVFFFNYARSLWEVRSGEQDEGEDGKRTMALFHRKANRGRLFRKPLGLTIHWGEEDRMIILSRGDWASDEIVAKHAPLSLRILEALKSGGKTNKELAELFGEGVKEKSIDKAARSSREIMRVDEGGRGSEATWGLKA